MLPDSCTQALLIIKSLIKKAISITLFLWESAICFKIDTLQRVLWGSHCDKNTNDYIIRILTTAPFENLIKAMEVLPKGEIKCINHIHTKIFYIWIYRICKPLNTNHGQGIFISQIMMSLK